jgi:selenocysteine-specific elongation factor
VLFVVAADEGWMPQSAEHLVALDVLGVRHGVLAVTKTDVMEPDLAAEEALEAIRRTSLGDVPCVPVSARTGAGLDDLRAALDRLVSGLPPGDADAPVRLWVDRGFTIRGAGLVVTGTLAAGTVRNGDTLELARTGKRYVVRELQSMNHHSDEARGVARVALNLRGAARGEVGRGDALMTPGIYRTTAVADARTRLCEPAELPRELLVHVGTATVEARVRPIGADTARLTLGEALPLRVGDRLVLRPDRGVAGGATVLDADPPRLNRRGAGRRRAIELESYADTPDGAAELRRRGIVRAGALLTVGVAPPVAPLVGDWLVDPEHARALRSRLASLVARRANDPSAPPLSVEDARRTLKLPDPRLVPAVLSPPWTVRDGMIVHADAPDTLPASVRDALTTLDERLAAAEFTVPTGPELAALGLGPAQIGAGVRAGRLVRLAPDVVLLPRTVRHAETVLAGLPQPFTAGEAREALGTSRKVIVPLLEHLASSGRTRRLPDGRHTVARRM